MSAAAEPRTYSVIESDGLGLYHVHSAPVDNPSNVRYEVGPFKFKNDALAEANLLASTKPGNRVES